MCLRCWVGISWMVYWMRASCSEAQLAVEPAPCSSSSPSSQKPRTASPTFSPVLRGNKPAVVRRLQINAERLRECLSLSFFSGMSNHWFWFFLPFSLPPFMVYATGCRHPEEILSNFRNWIYKTKISCLTYSNPLMSQKHCSTSRIEIYMHLE